MRTRRPGILIPLVLCALFLLLGSTSAGAASPALANAAPGKAVTVAPGYVVVPDTRAVRAAGGWQIRSARLRIGRTVQGERVRVWVEDSGRIVLRGGRFTIPRELSRRTLTIKRAVTIDDGIVSGGLRPEPGARRRSGSVVPEVGPALPAAPAGQEWSLSAELNAEGLLVRLRLGADDVGTVLIRFNGSYRVTLTLRDLDLFGSPVTISGEVSGDAILDFSSIRLRGTLTGRLTLLPGLELREATVIWDRNGFTVGGTIALACPEGGELITRAELALGTDLDNWSAGATLRAGATGCALSKELKLDAGTDLTATITNTRGQLSLAVTARAVIRTTLIPSQDAFTVDIDLRADAAGLKITLAGSAPGAAFSGAINPDGTFALDFKLTDLDLLGTKLSASGRVARTKPDGEITVTLRGGSDGQIWLVPNVLGITSVDLGWDPVTNRISVAAVLRLQCTSGHLSIGAGGVLEPPNKVTLDVAGDASRCLLADLGELDGRTLTGKIVLDGDKPPLIDFGISVAKLAIGNLDKPTADGAAFQATNLTARISNTCSLCRNGAALEIAFSGGIELAALTPGVAPGFIRIGLTIGFRVLLEGETPKAISLRITNLSLYGASSSLTIVLEGELLRTLEAALGLPPGSLQILPDDPAPVFEEDASVPRGRVVAVSATLGRCLAGRGCDPRVSVTVRTTGGGAVSLQLQRRTCTRRGCRWKTLTRSTLRPDASFVIRAKTSRRLQAGTYRLVASPAGRSGTTVRRTFRVLDA